MAQLAALLRTDLSRMAEEVRRAGRGKDTMLAHITPKEAALLKARGGRGSINPDTGLPEFETDDSENYDYGYEGAPYTQPVDLNMPQSEPIDMSGPIITETEAYDIGEVPAAGTRSFPFQPQYAGTEVAPSSVLPRLGSLGAGAGTGDASVAETMAQRERSGIDTGAGVAAATAPPQEKSILDALLS